MTDRTKYINRRMDNDFKENFVYKPLRILTLLSAPLLSSCGFADYMMKSSELSTRDHEAESRIELAAVNDRFTRVVEKNTALIESGQQLKREDLEVEKIKATATLAATELATRQYDDQRAVIAEKKKVETDRKHALDNLRAAPLAGTDPIEPVRLPGDYPTEFPWKYLVGTLAAAVIGLGAIGYGIYKIWQGDEPDPSGQPAGSLE